MKEKPVVEKLGFIPHSTALRLMSADQRGVTAAAIVLKTVIYFGSLGERSNKQIEVIPDFYGMYDALMTAVKLDPYNMDAYYFAQAFLTWDVHKIDEADAMVDYGMRYRTWDWYLPFFAGFNNAFFLKDYGKAASYFKRVGELTGSELSINLTGRYLYQSGQTELAIAYLSAMEKGATNEAVRRGFAMRLDAFKWVRRIETARDRYRAEHDGKLPSSVDLLVKDGYLATMPMDPYGGSFYLEKSGQVRSTSDFAAGWRENKIQKKIEVQQ
jgi:hypothetical protein